MSEPVSVRPCQPEYDVKEDGEGDTDGSHFLPVVTQ